MNIYICYSISFTKSNYIAYHH